VEGRAAGRLRSTHRRRWRMMRGRGGQSPPAPLLFTAMLQKATGRRSPTVQSPHKIVKREKDRRWRRASEGELESYETDAGSTDQKGG
jgi:hypothetical protein